MHKLKNGINHCSNEDYHGDKSYLSSSNLKVLLQDTEKFKKEFIDGESTFVHKPYFDEGNYAHSLILEPDTVEHEYAFYPGFRKQGKEWQQFKAEHEGKIMLSKPQKHRVEKWVEAYNGRQCAVDLISGGEAELSLAGELAGVPIKVRADYINVDKGYIADVKTTSHGSDVDSFSYVVKNLKYDLSAALYCSMFEKHFGKKFTFYFIVLGKRDIMCEVYKASSSTIDNGNMLVMEALRTYKQCKESGIWSGVEKPFISNDDYEILEV